MKFEGTRACVDSGQHRIGWAVGDSVRVLTAGLWRDDLSAGADSIPNLRVAWIPSIQTVIQEVPVSYPGARRGRIKRVNPNDLIGIAAKSGWFAGALAPGARYVPITPRRWKGTINGDVFLNLIWDKLTEAERALIPPSVPESLRHNVIDAMGMVLWTQGRL